MKTGTILITSQCAELAGTENAMEPEIVGRVVRVAPVMGARLALIEMTRKITPATYNRMVRNLFQKVGYMCPTRHDSFEQTKQAYLEAHAVFDEFRSGLLNYELRR